MLLFLAQCFFSNYADNINLYSTEKNIELTKMNLQTDFMAIIDFFVESCIVMNYAKCLYVCICVSGSNTNTHNVKKFENSMELLLITN